MCDIFFLGGEGQYFPREIKQDYSYYVTPILPTLVQFQIFLVCAKAVLKWKTKND